MKRIQRRHRGVGGQVGARGVSPVPANASRLEGSCHECRAPWNEGGGWGEGGWGHASCGGGGGSLGENRLGRMLPRQRVIGNLHVNGQSPQRAGREAWGARTHVRVHGPSLGDTGKTPAAFHLARYQDSPPQPITPFTVLSWVLQSCIH